MTGARQGTPQVDQSCDAKGALDGRTGSSTSPIDARAAPHGLLIARALLTVTYLLPLWNLTMFAPQYPEGLRLDIYCYKLDGGNAGQDVKEINVLNHYIGMRDLVNAEFTEFKWMPFVVGALGLCCSSAPPSTRTVGDARGRHRCSSSTSGPSRCGRSATSSIATAHELSPTAAVQVAAVHAADVRLPADRQLRGVLVSESRILRHGRGHRAAARGSRLDVVADAAGRAANRSRRPRPRHEHRSVIAGLRTAAASAPRPLPPRSAERCAGAGRRCHRGPARGPTRLAAPGAHRPRPARRSTSTSPAGAYEGDLIIDKPLTLVRQRTGPILLGLGHRQRGARARGRRHDRGVRHRRPTGRRPRPRHIRHPRGRATRDHPRLPHPRRAVRRSTSENQTMRPSRPRRSSAFPAAHPAKWAAASTCGTASASG